MRQPALPLDHAVAHQPIQQQVRVLVDAPGHVPVCGGLELDQHEDVRPVPVGQRALAEVHLPHHVAEPLAVVLVEVLGGDVLDRGEVQFVHPARHDEAQQVGHHRGERVEVLVCGVVIHAAHDRRAAAVFL